MADRRKKSPSSKSAPAETAAPPRATPSKHPNAADAPPPDASPAKRQANRVRAKSSAVPAAATRLNGHHPATPAARAAALAAPLPVKSLDNICVYCGSGPGRNPAYVTAARALGRSMAMSNVGLVYGGGGLGLMGETAKAVLDHKGRVTGIIPEFLSALERQLDDCTEVIVTADMHERKRLMFERSDAFVALPGGIGTLEELVEQLTWWQLGRHNKPVLLVNVDQFWTPFLTLIEHMRAEAFIRPTLDVRFAVVERAEDVVPTLKQIIANQGDRHPNAEFLKLL